MASAHLTPDRPAFRLGRLARTALAALLVAEAAAHLVRLAGLALVDVPPGYFPTDPVSLTVATAVGALGASLLHAGLERWTARPARLFVIVSAVVLLLSFGSVGGLRDMYPGVPAAALALSPILHVTVAFTSVATVLAMARRD